MATLEKIRLSHLKQELLPLLAIYQGVVAQLQEDPYDQAALLQYAELDQEIEIIASKIAFLETQTHHQATSAEVNDTEALKMPQASPLQNSIVWGLPPIELDLAESTTLPTSSKPTESATLKNRVQRLITYFKNPYAFQEATARELLQQGNSSEDLDKRLALYDQALQLNPQLSAGYFQRGNLHYQRASYAAALADYDQALQLDPQYVEAYHNRALTYYRRNLYDQALADFTTILELMPDSPEAYYNRAVVHQKKGDYRSTWDDATRSIELNNPHSYLPYQLRGEVLRLKKHYPEAIEDCTRALAIHPKYHLALGTRGAVYVAMEQYEQAMHDLSAALRINPTSSFIKYWLIIIKKRGG